MSACFCAPMALLEGLDLWLILLAGVSGRSAGGV